MRARGETMVTDGAGSVEGGPLGHAVGVGGRAVGRFVGPGVFDGRGREGGGFDPSADLDGVLPGGRDGVPVGASDGGEGEEGGVIGRGVSGSPPPGHSRTAIATRTAAVTAAASTGNAHRRRAPRAGAAARPASWNRRTVPGPAWISSAAAR
ncbi:hypothetical protein [Actinomadura rubrisoli]|uniref:Uncharacterized protein n=1 Tax=Actinomadura rubrisoli TaxID=2530368 RepID=A0A4R5A2H6_9ACTN|nr:hypothetical protein [Actinomadura rubrisoli]TDD65991.1 hypothetical protein E1298_40875 [Actinomadura rubrisoli]